MIWEVEIGLPKSKLNKCGVSEVMRIQSATEIGARELALAIWNWPEHGIEYKPTHVKAKPTHLLVGEIQCR